MTTVTRRTTAAASRRRFNAGDLFTACYSTILATAAVVDAKVKDDRRREWDRLIAEAKSIPIETPEGREGIPGGNIPTSFGEKSVEIRNPAPVIWDGIRWSTVTRSELHWTAQQVADSRDHATNPPWIPTDRSPSDSFDMKEEWIEDNPEGILPPREPKNHVQFRKVEETVARLVNRLLLQSKANPSFQSSSVLAGARADLVARMKEMTMRLDTLQDGNVRIPSYSHLDPASVRQEQAELHSSLIALLETADSDNSNIDVILAKVCYNLLISTSPPNISIYNILIEHFTRLERHDLAQIVVDSFFNESRYRPNAVTICLILDHFAAKGDSHGFRKIIKRMRGDDGDVRIKRRPLSILPIPSIQDWAMSNKVIHRNGFLIQKMPRNNQIFDSLIQGCLKLADISSAVRYFRAALREGCHVKSGILYRIADACVKKLDYKAGRSLLYTVLLQWEGGNSLDHPIEYCRTSRYAIYQILALCRVNLHSTEKLPVKSSREALQGLLLHMKIKSVTESVERSSERLSLIENLLKPRSTEDLAQELKTHTFALRLLGSQTFPDSAYERFDLAVQILKQASLYEVGRDKRTKQRKTKARLQALEATLLAQLKDFKSMQQMLLPISYNRLSPGSKSKYDTWTKQHQNIPISRKMAILMILHAAAGGGSPTRAKPPGNPVTEKPVSESKFRVDDIARPLEISSGSFCGSYPGFSRPVSVAQYQL